MVISHYQINRVIKAYMKHAGSRTGEATEDSVLISEESMKRARFERIGKVVVAKSKKHPRATAEFTDSKRDGR
jgi:hypothetical protein